MKKLLMQLPCLPLKWISGYFTPFILGKRVVQIQINGVPLEIKPEWLFAAILVNLEGTNVLTVH